MGHRRSNSLQLCHPLQGDRGSHGTCPAAITGPPMLVFGGPAEGGRQDACSSPPWADNSDQSLSLASHEIPTELFVGLCINQVLVL